MQGAPPPKHPGIWIAALSLVLAFAFLGSRGIWDPDEGRYTNVAINMLESGDWLNPKRNDDVGHWTKPPLTYWMIASSVGAFGLNPWAARLPVALCYLFCTWLVWRISRRLAPGAQAQSALIYATMLLPYGTAQLITTDYVLAACETLAIWAFVEARHGKAGAKAWIALMWAGFALAFMAKGPPGLLPLLVVLLIDWLTPGRHRMLQLSGLVVFVALALPWYVAVMLNNPGLFEYFIGEEVVNRIATDQFGRHGEWYGWIIIYAPTLLLGTLPWTPALWRWARQLPASLRRWRSADARGAEAPVLLLTAWVLLPLLVFCLSRSRLPLYILPLFVPLAILAAIQRGKEGRSLPSLKLLAIWVACLIAVRLGAAFWPTHKDTSEWSEAIRARTQEPVREIIFVEDMARYGLRLHLDAEVEKISIAPIPASVRPRFNPVNDEDLATELREAAHETGVVWICKQVAWPVLRMRILSLGHVATPLGLPYRGRVMFRTAPAPHTEVEPDRDDGDGKA